MLIEHSFIGILIKSSLKLIPKMCFRWWICSVCSGNSLARDITWTTDYPVRWCIHASLHAHEIPYPPPPPTHPPPTTTVLFRGDKGLVYDVHFFLCFALCNAGSCSFAWYCDPNVFVNLRCIFVFMDIMLTQNQSAIAWFTSTVSTRLQNTRKEHEFFASISIGCW